MSDPWMDSSASQEVHLTAGESLKNPNKPPTNPLEAVLT